MYKNIIFKHTHINRQFLLASFSIFQISDIKFDGPLLNVCIGQTRDFPRIELLFIQTSTGRWNQNI